VVLNPNEIPPVDPAVARLASKIMFGLVDARASLVGGGREAEGTCGFRFNSIRTWCAARPLGQFDCGRDDA
jgi:hypothetical protein